MNQFALCFFGFGFGLGVSDESIFFFWFWFLVWGSLMSPRLLGKYF